MQILNLKVYLMKYMWTAPPPTDLNDTKNSLVVHKGVHEQPLLDATFPLGLVDLQVAVDVVGHDDAARVEGQLDDELVVVADHPLVPHAARRRERQVLLPLQIGEDFLICKENVARVQHSLLTLLGTNDDKSGLSILSLHNLIFFLIIF